MFMWEDNYKQPVEPILYMCIINDNLRLLTRSKFQRSTSDNPIEN